MDIVENLAEWQADFEGGWLAHLQATGDFNWSVYAKVKNRTAPTGPGVDLSQSRLGLITTAGAYLRDEQEAFDAPDPIGDYTIRLLPSSTPFEAIAYAHTHYDQTAVNDDPQVLLPLRHLEALVAEGTLGELAPNVISYSGYMPDVGQVVSTLIPAIIAAAKADDLDAALLVPA